MIFTFKISFFPEPLSIEKKRGGGLKIHQTHLL